MQSGSFLIATERARQITEEGHTPSSDDRYTGQQLARAADSYLLAHTNPDEEAGGDATKTRPGDDWPWGKKRFKPSADPIRNLVMAGALIAAEIDRLQRKQSKKSKR
jgi:hypothetical protein